MVGVVGVPKDSGKLKQCPLRPGSQGGHPALLGRGRSQRRMRFCLQS